MPVTTLHRKYPDARLQWDRCRDAHAGSDAVKRKRTEYLPLLEGYNQDQIRGPYGAYLARALFYPAMARTVSGLAGLVFGKPPTVSGVAKSYQPEFDDVTQTGISLGAYGLELCQEALTTGRVGTLIDMPMGDFSAARPYWVTYAAENIINWRVEMLDGKKKLTLVVLMEERETLDKDYFAPTCTQQYRVLELVDDEYKVTVWVEHPDKKGTWLAEEPIIPLRRGTPLNFIPFVFLGPSGIDTEIKHPPLLDLVDVNYSHYRTSADQEHGAHFTALPTPYVTGHALKEGESLAIGSGTAWILPNPAATAGMVEFSGAGLAALKDIKEEKRQLMATLGARMLETQKNSQEAAQTVRLRHAGERSALSILAEGLGRHLTTAMRWHLLWDGLEEGAADKALFKLNPDVMDELTSDDISKLVAAWQAGAISHKTVYYNLEWGEWARPGVEFEEELSDIEDEAPDPLDLPIIVPVPGAPGELPKPGLPPIPPKPGLPPGEPK